MAEPRYTGSARTGHERMGATRTDDAMASTGRHAQLARYGLLADLFDSAFRIPGTQFRFGLDAILGLVPGAGDAISALFGFYGVWVARQLGAPMSIQLRMLANLGVDAIVGAIPILGDLFDFAFKAQVRNRQLLERWLQKPARTRRGSLGVIIGAAALILLIIAGAGWVAIETLRWLAQSLS